MNHQSNTGDSPGPIANDIQKRLYEAFIAAMESEPDATVQDILNATNALLVDSVALNAMGRLYKSFVPQSGAISATE